MQSVWRCGLVLSFFTALASPAVGEVDFNRDICPILAKNCFACHGPDEHARQANLRLDTRDGATGNNGGHVGIIPGDSANSRVVARIMHETMPMPPKGAGEPLSSAQVDLIKAWIDEGANYAGHWAFESPVRHERPTVQNESWPRNEIDYFVLARLEGEGLQPSPEADKHALIRRVALDLTGLPPSPKQVSAFLADEEAGAYERLVHRLLNSPSYGERWARVWLDLARYADSKGYEKDDLRTIWPYRDWVIRALNDNMPFDRFTLLQLGGDLLPVPTRDQLIATGFHRNTMTNDEGGTDDEEFRDAAVKDRLATTFQVWMGLTAGCAQCHTHKYDPISHQEFYQLYAFFNQTQDADKVDDTPVLEIDDDTTTLIMRELPQGERRQTRIHNRGNFMDKGEPVEAAVPAAFHPLPEAAPANRLALAKWLTDKRNPLTARVTVNRFWARLFGRGFVETEEDFGNQGQLPSHPKLLDWLATEFMRLDWDMKAILKTMVMSATYRQSSDVDADLLKADPLNRLLARGPRSRLEAEMIRDQMLAVSGLLSDRMYGPPVMPLQPAGLWKVPYSSDKWVTSPGEDRYRRSLYTLWRRTSPYPSMTTFDAPTGELCALRRVPTNTPLQALVALNDPLALEAAQRLAERVLAEAGENVGVDDRLRHAFELVLVRPPRQEEIERLRNLYHEAQASFERDGEAALEVRNVDRTTYREDRLEWIVGGPDEEPGSWKYTTAKAAQNWNSRDFDASFWQQGRGMFGFVPDPPEGKKPSKYAARIGTDWKSELLLLRREFEVPAGGLEDFRLHVDYRGEFKVYFNGVLAAETEEDTAGSKDLIPYDRATATIRPGLNVVAVQAAPERAAESGQYVDVRLSAARPPSFTPSADDSLRAAWVMVSHVLLNLDETLTKR